MDYKEIWNFLDKKNTHQNEFSTFECQEFG